MHTRSKAIRFLITRGLLAQNAVPALHVPEQGWVHLGDVATCKATCGAESTNLAADPDELDCPRCILKARHTIKSGTPADEESW